MTKRINVGCEQGRDDIVNSLVMILHLYICRALYKSTDNATEKAEYIEEALSHINEIIHGSLGWVLEEKLGHVVKKPPNNFSAYDSSNHEEKLNVITCILSELSSLLPSRLHEEFIFNLDALIYGDQPDLLKPADSGRHQPAKTLERLRIKAHEHVAFRSVYAGVENALTDVAHAYSKTASGIQKRKNKKRMGVLERSIVSRREQRAKLAAENLKEYLTRHEIKTPPLQILSAPESLDKGVDSYRKKHKITRSKSLPLHPYAITQAIKLYSEKALLDDGMEYQALSPKARQKPEK